MNMDTDLDIESIARWAIQTYGADAVPIIRRCAAQNLMADDPEAAACWRQVADLASDYLASRSLH